MATNDGAAANQSGNAGSGQAAGAQQGAQQSGQQGAQSGQGQQGQGQQGDQAGSGQQAGAQGAQQGAQQQGDQQGAQSGQAGAQQQGDQGAQAGPPEKYELVLPEQSPLDQADIEAISTIAKKKGWTNDQAQAALTEMSSSLAEQTASFRSRLDAHPELGGSHLEATQIHVKRALDRFLPESVPEGVEFRAAMNKSGYGNYVPLVMLLARIGKAMSEDQPGHGAQSRAFGEPPKKSQAERLFGDAQGVQP